MGRSFLLFLQKNSSAFSRRSEKCDYFLRPFSVSSLLIL